MGERERAGNARPARRLTTLKPSVGRLSGIFDV
jgi:hypothetical protein